MLAHIPAHVNPAARSGPPLHRLQLQCPCCRDVARESNLVEDISAAGTDQASTLNAAGSNANLQLAEQVADLQQRLEKAEATGLQWRSQHKKLHDFCVDQLLPPPLQAAPRT